MSIERHHREGKPRSGAKKKISPGFLLDMSDYGLVTTTKELFQNMPKVYLEKYPPMDFNNEVSKLTVRQGSLLNTWHIIMSNYIHISFADKIMKQNFLFHISPIISNLGDTKDAIKVKH